MSGRSRRACWPQPLWSVVRTAKIYAGPGAHFRFLLNLQAENPSLPFPEHTRCILAHRGLETQSKLTERHRLDTSIMGQTDRPSFCLPALQEGMTRIDPIESRLHC